MGEGSQDQQLWWHAHGAVAPSGNFMLLIAGETTIRPERVSLWITIPDPVDRQPVPLAYLRTWDHEPSEQEKAELTPPGYEEEPEAEWTGRT